MDKNSIIGLVLIGAVLFGFSWYQSDRFKKQQAQVQAYNDSLAREQVINMAMDSLKAMNGESSSTVAVKLAKEQVVAYKDTGLCRASVAEQQNVVLENDKMVVTLTNKGAQPLSVRLKDFKAYGGDSLVLVKEGASDYNLNIYAGESINTRDFSFDVVSCTDSSAVMRLNFDGGAYIQQEYVLPKDSYMLHNALSFKGMSSIIPRNVTMFDIDWYLDIPRLEKGYKNEKQYSKMSVLCGGETMPEIIGKNGKNSSKRFDTSLEWFGFNQQFFSAFMTAAGGFSSGDFNIAFADERNPDQKLMSCSAKLRNELRQGDTSYEYDFYFGPNNYRILRSYDRNYDKVITIGGRVIGLITRYVIIPCFELLGKFFNNYGVIILLMTILIKLVISPLTVKSYISSAKMNAIKPEVDKISEKYPKAATDQAQAMKKQQATMALYKQAGINPAGGCLPMLLQFPILWAMFRFFPASIELRQQKFLWAEDLSAYDSIVDFGFSVLGMDHLSLFALLMAVSMFFYSMMTMPKSNDPQMAPMRFMSVYLMPVMMFFICNSLSAGLSYYYLISNLITMLQTFVIRKWVVKPEKLMAEIAANKNKPIVKSKWQQRLEAAQKMAEAQQRAARR